MKPRTVTLMAALAIACTGSPASQATTAGAVDLRVIDSSQSPSVWTPMADSVTVYRVEARVGGRTDTVVDVIYPLPIRVSRDTVAGLQLARTSAADADRRLFLLTGTAPLRTWPVPADVHYVYEDIAIAPDGKHFAYVASDSASGLTYAVVRVLATGEVLVQGPRTGGCECDVDMNHARWVAADSVEIAVRHSDGFTGWLLVAANIRTGRTHLDTLKAEPKWH